MGGIPGGASSDANKRLPRRLRPAERKIVCKLLTFEFCRGKLGMPNTLSSFAGLNSSHVASREVVIATRLYLLAGVKIARALWG